MEASSFRLFVICQWWLWRLSFLGSTCNIILFIAITITTHLDRMMHHRTCTAWGGAAVLVPESYCTATQLHSTIPVPVPGTSTRGCPQIILDANRRIHLFVLVAHLEPKKKEGGNPLLLPHMRHGYYSPRCGRLHITIPPVPRTDSTTTSAPLVLSV